MNYRIPDPKTEPIKCLVLAYKVTKGVAHDDKTWDAVHFSRVSKPAKALLEICGSVRVADSCLVEVGQKFDEANINWTLETIVKHAHEWISKKRGKTNGNAYRARFFKALSEQGRVGDHPPDSENETTLPNSGGSLSHLKKVDFKDPD